MLILLPGLLCNEQLFAPQIAALAGQMPCKVMDLTKSDSMSGLADDVLAHAPERFSLAGLSMGGYVAMEIMRKAPERVERLALLDTTAAPDTAEQTARRHDAIAIAEAGHFDKILPGMLPNLVHPLHMDRVGPVAKDMAQSIGSDAFIRQQMAIMNRIDSRPSLGDIKVPTLVLVGANDQLTPPDKAKEMADLMNKSRLVVIGSCGHLSPLEQPEAISGSLSYWLQD